MGCKIDWRASERRKTRYERREGWTTDKTEVVGGRREAESRQQGREKLPDVGNSWQRRRGKELTW